MNGSISSPRSASPLWPGLAWLLLGGVLTALAYGRPALPVAAWLAPMFLMRFMRTARPVWALPAFVVVHTLTWDLAYLGTVLIPLIARVALFGGLSLVMGLVFLLDRWVASRSDAFVTTLVFPCGWVTFEFLNGVFSPSGSWGSVAYAFSEQLVMAQIVSITGWTGIAFLLGWTAATINWAWQRSLNDAGSRRGLLVTASVIAAVHLFGAVRLALPTDTSKTVRVAAIVAPGTFRGPHVDELWAYTRGVDLDDVGVEKARRQIETSRRRHFALVEREIAGGAKLLVWAEANAVITKTEEPAWIEQAQQIARRSQVWVGMGLMVYRPQAGQPSQNKLILIGPEGEVATEFLKANRVPGSSHVEGDGKLPLLETEHGRLSTAICFDMDFPRLLGQAGRQRADIVIAPSNDWPEVRFVHARMAVMRGIEQGFNLFRPTKDGISLVADHRGRVLARHDTGAATERVLVANVPTRGTTTVYARLGDLFSYLCCAGLIGVPAVVVLGGRRRRAGHAAAPA